MDQVSPVTLDDTVDGLLLSQTPGSHPNQVTFIGRPNSCARLSAGDESVEVQFMGGRFTHNHPLVIKELSRMARSGTGIHILPATTEELKAAKSTDVLTNVTKEVTAYATAVAAAAAAVKK